MFAIVSNPQSLVITLAFPLRLIFQEKLLAHTGWLDCQWNFNSDLRLVLRKELKSWCWIIHYNCAVVDGDVLITFLTALSTWVLFTASLCRHLSLIETSSCFVFSLVYCVSAPSSTQSKLIWDWNWIGQIAELMNALKNALIRPRLDCADWLLVDDTPYK